MTDRYDTSHLARSGRETVDWGDLLATLMALQAGLPVLDFSELDGVRREEYFAAVRAGMDMNYQPMKQLFNGVIERSLQASQEP